MGCSAHTPTPDSLLIVMKIDKIIASVVLSMLDLKYSLSTTEKAILLLVNLWGKCSYNDLYDQIPSKDTFTIRKAVSTLKNKGFVNSKMLPVYGCSLAMISCTASGRTLAIELNRLFAERFRNIIKRQTEPQPRLP